MFPLLLLIPGVWFVWTLAQRAALRKVQERAELERLVRSTVAQAMHPASVALPAYDPGPAVAVTGFVESVPVAGGDYASHLSQAAWLAAAINTVRPAAMVADVGQIMSSGPEVAAAFHALAAPMDALTAERDLNLLGARPALREDGRASRTFTEALMAFQAEMHQPQTGKLDAPTCFALRYSAGTVHAQNQSGLS